MRKHGVLYSPISLFNMALKYFPYAAGQLHVIGLSSDTKPVTPTNGWTFLEEDTGKTFRVESGSWVEKINSSYATTASTVAASAILQTARNINGVAFNGSADITVPAAGSTLSDAVPNSKLATMTQKTYKGRTTTSTGAPEDVAVATLKSDLVLVKGDVGLGNVDNTSDASKPVSTATQTALDGKSATSHNHTGVYAPVLGSDDNYVTDAEKVVIGNTSGTNSGNQTSIVGITGTVAQFNTAITDGDLATGGGTAVGTNTGDNATNSNYSGLVSNATHTGDATGATALTVVKINGVTMSGLATGILKNTTTTGVPSIAVAGDFPTLNQSTTGSAATLTTPRTIGGRSFDGSAAIVADTYKCGITTRDINAASATVNVAHGLGRVPSFVRVTASIFSAATTQGCFGVYDGTNHTGLNTTQVEGTSTAVNDAIYSSTAFELGFSVMPTVVNPYTGANRQTATITCDATNIIFTWTKTGTVAAAVANILWECS